MSLLVFVELFCLTGHRVQTSFMKRKYHAVFTYLQPNPDNTVAMVFLKLPSLIQSAIQVFTAPLRFDPRCLIQKYFITGKKYLYHNMHCLCYLAYSRWAHFNPENSHAPQQGLTKLLGIGA
jgi:hypothetical protein